jgi:hypothetical protein
LRACDVCRHPLTVVAVVVVVCVRQGLSELLHSPSAAESWQGELWLFELLQLSMDTRKGAMPEQQQAPVRDLFHGLLASDNPRVRRIYSSVTERLLLSLKAQVHNTRHTRHTRTHTHTHTISCNTRDQV